MLRFRGGLRSSFGIIVNILILFWLHICFDILGLLVTTVVSVAQIIIFN